MSPPETGLPVHLAVRLFSAACVHLAEIGIDPAPLLRDVGLPGNILDAPDRRVPQWQLVAFLADCEAHTGDQFFGLHAGARFRAGDYGLLEALVRHSGDASEIPGLVNRFSPLLGGTGRPLLQRSSKDLIVYTITTSDREPTTCQGFVYYAMTSAHLMARHFMDGEDLISWASFRHKAPVDKGEVASVFGTDLRFGAEANALAFEVRGNRERPNVLDRQLRDLLQRQAETRLGALSRRTPTTRAVRAVLWQALAEDFAGAVVASRLAMSERTLRRRLREEGSSFSGVRDAVRRVRALEMLGETDAAIADIACQLGYAETSGLHRAFKRWTSETPGVYRERARAGNQLTARAIDTSGRA